MRIAVSKKFSFFGILIFTSKYLWFTPLSSTVNFLDSFWTSHLPKPVMLFIILFHPLLSDFSFCKTCCGQQQNVKLYVSLYSRQAYRVNHFRKRTFSEDIFEKSGWILYTSNRCLKKLRQAAFLLPHSAPAANFVLHCHIFTRSHFSFFSV